MAPGLSIVVVSYNTRDLLRSCLLSVLDSPFHRVESGAVDPRQYRDSESRLGGRPADATPQTSSVSSDPALTIEIIVIDNGSADRSAEMVESEFPTARLISSPENLGFARASNLGIQQARGKLILLLNPDTEVVGDALIRLASFLETHEDVAAAGPSLQYADGSPQHAAFRFPSLWMSFFDFFPLNHRLLNSRLNGRYPLSPDSDPFPIGHPLGAAMLISRRALKQVGLLDERFFIYCEEIDWCIRARRAGWEIYQVPSARVVHHGGQSTVQFREAMLVELHRSRYTLFTKHYSRRFISAHRLITRCGLLKQSLTARWVARRGGMDPDQLRSRLRAYAAIWEM